MAAFRQYSDRLKFRDRSENPDVAVELSMQPYEAFGVDGVIMFSDILTPLPALGVEFDVVTGKGPVIFEPLRTREAIEAMTPLDDPQRSLPFIEKILSTLAQEVKGKATLLGFVGAPFTLAAYSIEGGSSKECKHTKRMMMYDPALLSLLLDKLAVAIGRYACYQIESGAQVRALFLLAKGNGGRYGDSCLGKWLLLVTMPKLSPIV
jgi:uroporphyrinogen decarboxylase